VWRPILGAAAPLGRSSPWLYQLPKSSTHSNHPIHPCLLSMLSVDV
jgi:hypothetical protein